MKNLNPGFKNRDEREREKERYKGIHVSFDGREERDNGSEILVRDDSGREGRRRKKKGAWRIDEEENPLLFSFSRFRYFLSLAT